MISWTTDDSIHRNVKRDIPASERGTIATLNDLPDWMIDEARTIGRESRLGAMRYLRFYVATQYGSSAEDFVEEVLLAGDDARTWRIWDCIFVPEEPVQIVKVDADRYLEALTVVDGERWFRIKPQLSDSRSDFLPGMVGVMKRNCRYWHTTPSEIIRCPLVGSTHADPIDAAQLQGYIRRWIAHRLAWWARQYLDRHRSHVTSDEIIAATSDSNTPLSATSDVHIAASALALEALTYGNSSQFPQQAGFLGPGEWYQSVEVAVANP